MTTSRTDTAPQVRDNTQLSRYEVLVGDVVAGHLDYHRSQGRILIPSTVVLPAYRGHGLASLLVEQVMDDVRRDGLSVSTSCWYVRDWLAAHSDYQDLQVR